MKPVTIPEKWPPDFHQKESLSKMTQNRLKWILNTTFKKLTFQKISTPNRRIRRVIKRAPKRALRGGLRSQDSTLQSTREHLRLREQAFEEHFIEEEEPCPVGTCKNTSV